MSRMTGCRNGNSNRSNSVNQPERTELEYRVIALNKGGEEQASNMAMAVW
jgi:hypothetical protein